MITIRRDSGYADRIRNYRVELDGKVVGEIADGETKRFETLPGKHTLLLRIDWARSNKIEFETTTQRPAAHFQCASSLRGRQLWFAVVYAIFLPHKYIKLTLLDN